MEAIHNEIPEEELGEMKITLRFDIFIQKYIIVLLPLFSLSFFFFFAGGEDIHSHDVLSMFM